MRKCFQCDSENVIKLIPAKALIFPEKRAEIESGIAEILYECAAFQTGYLWKCKDCGYKWDPLMEKQLKTMSEETKAKNK